MKKVKLGIIGCGSRSNAHQTGFLKLDNVDVIAVADPIEERRNAAAAKFGCTGIYKDHTELYDAVGDQLDAVLISVEPTAHTDIEERAVELGIPFLIEKPMTLDLEQADRLVAAIKEKQLITAVGFQDRYLDLINIIKEDLPNHQPGGLVYGAWIGGTPSPWWWQKKSTCGGQLVEQNIHLVDGLRYLFGEPISVWATAERGILVPGKNASDIYDSDDHSTAVFRFENHVTATLVSGCYARRVRPRCGLYISLDDITYDYRLRNNLIISTPVSGVPTPETRDIPRGNEPTYVMDRLFIEAVATGNRSLIRSDYEDGVRTLKMAFAANRSMETGEVIYFNKE